MIKDQYPRVLMVLMTKVKAEDPGNLLIRAQFGDWPKDRLAQIHAAGDPAGHGEFCGHYYKLAVGDRVCGRLFRRLRGGVLDMVAMSAVNEQVAVKPAGWWGCQVRMIKKYLGDWVIGSGWWEVIFRVRLSGSLLQFVEGFKPDLVYCQGYSLGFATLPLLIARRFKIPVCFQTTDDWPRGTYARTPVGWLLRRRARELIHYAKARFAFGAKMQREYQRRYDVPFEATYHLDDPARFLQPIVPTGRLYKIVYTGSLGHRRYEAIQDVLQAARQIPELAGSFEIIVYSSGIPKDMPASLLQLPEVRFSPLPAHDQLPAALAEATLLLLPESFTEVHQAIEYSISSKSHLYMMSQCPVLVYGPPYSGTVDYALREGWGLVVAERSVAKLKDALKEILAGGERMRLLRSNARACIERHHDITSGRKKFCALLAHAAHINKTIGASLQETMLHKIKVGVFCSFYPTYRDAVLTHLSQDAHLEFTFLGGSPPAGSFIREPATRSYTFHPIRCFAIHVPGTRNFISYRCGAVWALLRHKYNVLILPNDILGLDVWLCCLLARCVRVPVCIWGQGMSRPPSKFRNTLRWLLTHLASAAVYYSEGGKQYWMDHGIPARKLFVAYNALDTNQQIKIRDTINQEDITEFLRVKGLAGKRLVVYLGRLIPVKQPSVFIDAVAAAHSQDSRVVGILIGDGPQRGALEQHARDRNLLGAVILFTEEVYDERVLARYLMASSAMVLPAAAGLAIQHAAVYGTPLILGDIPNMHLPEQEIVEEGKTGLWCPEGDADTFAAAILRLVHDPAFRDTLSVNIKQIINDKYNVARMAQGFIDAARYCAGK